MASVDINSTQLCINQWRRRLQGVVQENGGHIEHVVQLAVDICTLAFLVVADIIRDELFASLYMYIAIIGPTGQSRLPPQ